MYFLPTVLANDPLDGRREYGITVVDKNGEPLKDDTAMWDFLDDHFWNAIQGNGALSSAQDFHSCMSLAREMTDYFAHIGEQVIQGGISAPHKHKGGGPKLPHKSFPTD